MACGVNPRRTEAMTRYARQRWQSVAQVLRSPAEGGGSVGADQFVTFLSILLRPCYLSKLINPLQTRRCYDVTTPTRQGTTPCAHCRVWSQRTLDREILP